MASYWDIAKESFESGDLKAAIEVLEQTVQDERTLKNLSMLKFRLNSVESKFIKGMVDFGNYELEKNKILGGLTELIQFLDKGGVIADEVDLKDGSTRINVNNQGTILSDGNFTIRAKNFAGRDINTSPRTVGGGRGLLKYLASLFRRNE